MNSNCNPAVLWTNSVMIMFNDPSEEVTGTQPARVKTPPPAKPWRVKLGIEVVIEIAAHDATDIAQAEIFIREIAAKQALAVSLGGVNLSAKFL